MAAMLATTCFTTFSSHALQSATQAAANDERVINNERVTEFSQEEAKFKQQRDALLAQKAQLDADIEVLSNTFSDNEQTLAELEESLRLETGSLGELFGVVRKSAKELQLELETSVTAFDKQSHNGAIDDIIAARKLPTIEQLTAMWAAMEEQVIASGEITAVEIPAVGGDGVATTLNGMRLGAIGVVSDNGYMSWNGSNAQYYPRQPENTPTRSNVKTDGAIQQLPVDPSRGEILTRLADVPDLKQRLENGGIVGKIILGLLGFGVIISLYRGVELTMISTKIRAQLKKPQTPGNNPLGRILSVYDAEKNRSVEALELRLLEQVIDEQQGLEKGLSMIKLLAAIAPMLGLLGTVTGMIETFQVITQFGNGDPTIMAGGISMALITTVLGLIAAMPLLLAHNLLSTKVDNIKSVLEKQGISLVAERAESDDQIELAAA
nr:MotA/TolQ/ExbB proton channel family protein [Thaumasiovibrio subtropicus]